MSPSTMTRFVISLPDLAVNVLGSVISATTPNTSTLASSGACSRSAIEPTRLKEYLGIASFPSGSSHSSSVQPRCSVTSKPWLVVLYRSFFGLSVPPEMR